MFGETACEVANNLGEPFDCAMRACGRGPIEKHISRRGSVTSMSNGAGQSYGFMRGMIEADCKRGDAICHA